MSLYASAASSVRARAECSKQTQAHTQRPHTQTQVHAYADGKQDRLRMHARLAIVHLHADACTLHMPTVCARAFVQGPGVHVHAVERRGVLLVRALECGARLVQVTHFQLHQPLASQQRQAARARVRAYACACMQPYIRGRRSTCKKRRQEASMRGVKRKTACIQDDRARRAVARTLIRAPGKSKNYSRVRERAEKKQHC